MNLNQVTVPSLDVDTSIVFYQQLGLRLIVHSSPRYARFECVEGDATFSIHLVDELPTGNGVYIYFETSALDLEVKRLISAGIEFEQLPTDQTWRWREARLKDPDRNQLILFNAGENRKDPPWRISSDRSSRKSPCLRKQSVDRVCFNQFPWLVQVVQDHGFRVDTKRMIN